MYARPQNYRYTGDVRLPQNYSGNTFRQSEEEKDEEKAEPISTEIISEEGKSEAQDGQKAEAREVGSLLPKPNFKLGSLFGNNKKGVGTEELLIIALILLLADGDENNDLILFLILLLFIG